MPARNQRPQPARTGIPEGVRRHLRRARRPHRFVHGTGRPEPDGGKLVAHRVASLRHYRVVKLKTAGSEGQSAERTDRELRQDTQLADQVDAALSIAALDGIARALDYMQRHGVDHDVAIRVLASPHLHHKHAVD